MEDPLAVNSTEKDHPQTATTSSTLSPTKIGLRDKLFNTTTIMIPHLEGIILDKTDKTSTYRVISKCLLEQLTVLKKRLLIIDAALERKELSSSSTLESSAGRGKKVTKYAEILGVPVHYLTSGEFNHREVENVLDYTETYMFYPAFKKWRTIPKRTSLAKRMLVFLRKLDLVLNVCIPFAMKTPLDDLMSLPRHSEAWKQLDEVTTYIQVFSEEKIKECWASQNEFLYVVQAALAKTTGALLDVKKMKDSELEEYMQVHFFDLEAWKEKRKLEGTKQLWQKNFVPKLNHRFWQNVFRYMLNRDSVTEDVELFIAYPSKDVIRDYWNMAETYAAKVSRRLLYGPIATRKVLYLHPNILEDHLVNTSQQSNVVSHLIDKKWRFLGKHKTAKLSISEMFPRDLYFDTNHEDRIGITLLAHCAVSIESIIEQYVNEQSNGECAPPSRLKPGKNSHATVSSSQKSQSSSPEKRKVSKTPQSGSKQLDSVTPALNPTHRTEKQKAGKMGWMMGKMMGVAQMLGLRVGATKTPNSASKLTPQSRSEMTSSCDDPEEQSDEDPYQGYQNFQDDSSGSDTNKARPASNYAEDILEEPGFARRSPSTKSHRPDRPTVLVSGKGGQSDGESRRPTKPDVPTLPPPKKFQLTPEQEAIYAQSILEMRTAAQPDQLEDHAAHVQASSQLEAAACLQPDMSNGPRSTGSSKSVHEPSQQTDKNKELFKKIIIHIHGGGFMAMSSSYHETYLRLFVNELERPLFSIDYRLAPQVKYPQPLHDCIKGYLWIRQFVEDVIGTTLESVILIGDSAGGNLAFALTYWLIENNLKVPDLLVSCYSALRLQTRTYTPSFFKSMEEYFLSYAGLWACCKQYLPDNADSSDKFISPIFAEQDLLRKMPSTRMFVCLDDPLKDDQLRMSKNLLDAGVDVKVKCFHHFIHGMLSLNRNECLPVKVFQDEVIAAMREHLRPARSPSFNSVASDTSPTKSSPQEGTGEDSGSKKTLRISLRDTNPPKQSQQTMDEHSQGIAPDTRSQDNPPEEHIDTPIDERHTEFPHT